MAKGIKELQREVRELHEKNRQDAMRKFKGEQLDEVLRKLDELYLPLERLSSNPQIGENTTKKQFFAFVLVFLLGIMFYFYARTCFDSVLFFHERMNWLGFFFLFPLTSAGTFYLVSAHLLRAQSRGIQPPFMKYGPLLRYPVMFLFSLTVGTCALFILFYLPMSVGMSFMNSQQVRVDSLVVDIKAHGGRGSYYDCRVSASRGGQGTGDMPVETTFVLPESDIDLPLKQGDRIQIIGRESFAGIVADKVKKAP